MIGMGLDEINGYLCIGSDWNTIKGVAFDHKGETPGLGADWLSHGLRINLSIRNFLMTRELCLQSTKGKYLR